MQTIKITGKIRLQHFRDGKCIKDTGFLKNIITNAGKAQIALLAGDASATPFTYLALGTSATAVAATDTALIAEIVDTGLSRTTATVSRTTTSVTNDTLSLVYSWTATGAKTIQEVGILNASSTGTLLGRKLTGATTVANLDVLQVTYTIQFS